MGAYVVPKNCWCDWNPDPPYNGLRFDVVCPVHDQGEQPIYEDEKESEK